MSNFDISAYAAGAGVLKINTSAEGFEMVRLDLIDENPLNFFAVEDDITELAESIQISGLMQPLVVCKTEEGRYRLIAGHRRRKALIELLDKDAKRWELVPCHVLPQMSEAMEELILIQTNTMAREIRWDTRCEAIKRTEAALVKLQEESGVKLPGRMREKVAHTLKISEAAVARLKAIDKRTIPEIKAIKIPESLAYEISQLPPEQQSALLHVPDLDKVRAYDVKHLAENISKWDKSIGRKCKHKSGECCHQGDMLVGRLGRSRLPSTCLGSCCCECSNLEYCKYPCETGKAKAVAAKAKKDADIAKFEEEKKVKQEKAKLMWAGFWARFKDAREERGLSIDNCRDAYCSASAYSPYFPPESFVEECEAGERQHEFNNVQNLISLADALGVSLDWLFGRDQERCGAADGKNAQKMEEPKEEEGECARCKAAHPFCEGCCNTCKDHCNSWQGCSKGDKSETETLFDALKRMSAKEQIDTVGYDLIHLMGNFRSADIGHIVDFLGPRLECDRCPGNDEHNKDMVSLCDDSGCRAVIQVWLESPYKEAEDDE